jgi:hypothetical protein
MVNQNVNNPNGLLDDHVVIANFVGDKHFYTCILTMTLLWHYWMSIFKFKKHIFQKVTNVDLLLHPNIQCLRKNYKNFTKLVL